MVEVLYQQSCRVRITTSITKESTRQTCYVFADGTDLVDDEINEGHLDVEEVIDWNQKAIYSWEGYLKFVGSAIRPEKSFAWIFYFGFK